MQIWEIFVIAVGLSMDAFAVSVCKGLSVSKSTLKQSLTAGIWFGGFQALMPVLGYLVGMSFAAYITAFDHWIAFGLLAIIGGNMIKESFDKNENEMNDSFGIKTMLLLAIATSIDALATGITFSCLNANIWSAAAIIGATTFIISAFGIKIGNVFGGRFKAKAELAGGIILVLIGVKILVEHLVGFKF